MPTTTDISQYGDIASVRSPVFVTNGDQLLLTRESSGALCLPTFEQLAANTDNGMAIGRCNQRSHFLLPQTASYSPGIGEWFNVRQLVGLLNAGLFMLAGRAIQLQHWLNEHRYCGRCGAACYKHHRELAMACPDCGFFQYPRINPCIIVLITRQDKALLAQGVRFPDGLYSCLAGFIEAGETAEEAVQREVREEVGIEIADLRYYGSQAWPFPHSLMLGYHARWKAGDITPQKEEIVTADWFTRDQLPTVPGKGSIAHDLIEAWRVNTVE